MLLARCSNRFWMSGGAGYILSSAAYGILVEKLQAHKSLKNVKNVAEDAMMGYLMGELQAQFIHFEVKVI